MLGYHLDIIIIPVYLLIAALVTIFYGVNKEIGMWWVLFFSIFFTPIVGFIIAYYSPKWVGGEVEIPKPNFWSNLLTAIFSLLAIIYLINIVNFLIETGKENDDYLLYKPTKYVDYLPSEGNSILGSVLVFISFTGGALYSSRNKRYRFNPSSEREPYKLNFKEVVIGGSKTQNMICYIMSGLLLLLLIAVIINNYF